MNDITLEELRAALPADIATAINAVALPANTTTAEFLNKILVGANQAAVEKNVALPAGEKITSYGLPVFSSVQTSAGAYFINQSIALTTRQPLGFDSSVAINA